MNVYWSVIILHDEISPFLTYEEPKTIAESLNAIDTSTLKPGDNFKYCPAFRKQSSNTFKLSFPFDYRLSFENNNIKTDMYDQRFFDAMVSIRSPEMRMLSLNLHYLFVAEESLEMATYPSYMSDNDFAVKTILIPGQFDIGRWVRPLDCAFMMRKGFDEVNINRGDEYLTIKFLTDEKINLKKFFVSPILANLIKQNVESRTYKKKAQPLQYYYNLYQRAKMHKLIMKEIKNNLMD
jgi:hypothetical protein